MPRSRDDFGQADYSTDYAYDPDSRTGYRNDRYMRPSTSDYGQADYSTDYAYDSRTGQGYRRFSEGDRSFQPGSGRAYADAPHDDEGRRPRRHGPSDRVLWAVIVERLEDERRLDLRDVEVLVENGEVTLNGTVRRKEDKRRIEDVADIDGVRHVQNNLRVRDHRGWF